jgi:hypothetical protein
MTEHAEEVRRRDGNRPAETEPLFAKPRMHKPVTSPRLLDSGTRADM